jgi:hypothetical protein
MNTKWVYIIVSLSLFLAGQLYAGSVYFWTDENGVRHFSNTGIPDEVQEAAERPEESSPPQASKAISDATPDTDSQEPPVGPQEEEAESAAPGSGGDEQIDDRLAAKAEKERQRLEAEIKRIEGRSMSKTYTQGMKDAQLAPLKEQLALLNADPERYFRMKRQGAFQSSSGSGSGTGTASTADILGGRLSSESGRSSASGGQADRSSAAPDDTDEDTSVKEESGDEKQSRRSRSSESAESTLFPEND